MFSLEVLVSLSLAPVPHPFPPPPPPPLPRARGSTQLHDVVETRRELHLVLTLATGGDVATRLLHHGPFPETDAADVAAQIGSALRAVHAAGFVHCDVKPANCVYMRAHSGARASGARRAHIALADFG